MNKFLIKLKRIFNSYFDLHVYIITDPHLLGYEGLFLNGTYIFGNYEIEYYSLTEFTDAKKRVINQLFLYLIQQAISLNDQYLLTNRQIQFVDKFYVFCDDDIFQMFIKHFNIYSNDRFNSYLCLKTLT